MSSPRIAALFVEKNGAYANLDGVDLWDIERDARHYNGPWPVVAHPPCSRWCQLAGLVQARWGHKVGDDQGCFLAALAAVRQFGGVLEHPAYSKAWPHYGLPKPDAAGGWNRNLFSPGEGVCHVEQGNYGHAARKATWLFAKAPELPDMRWGRAIGGALVSWCGNREFAGNDRPRIGKKAAAATPLEFRDALLSIARSVPQPESVR